VGFLHNLPHHLIEAFHATLEEVVEADLLIHVLDANHPRVQEHNQAVFTVLEQLHCENKPLITALNKIDILKDKAWLSWLNEKFTNSVCISAKARQNLGQLVEKIEDFLKPQMSCVLLSVPLNQMAIVDFLYRQGKVKKVEYETKRVKIEVNLAKNLLTNVLKNKEVRVIS
jgi:GTP-binding protein HflX